jgi:sialate O-acetylesterase
MTPPVGFRYYPLQLAHVSQQVALWTPTTPPGKEAYLKSIGEIKAWLAETRAVLARGEVTFEDIPKAPRLPGPPAFERAPTTQYNDVIHRVRKAAVRGIILETHTHNVGDPFYTAKAMALIKGLREVMGRTALPVCVLQMSSPHRYERNATEDPKEWVMMREAQSELMRMDPSITVVASYDIGPDEREAIPTDRALRAAQWAAALLEGRPVKTGPVARSHRIDGARIFVAFDHVGKGLMAGLKKPARPVQPAPNSQIGGFQLRSPEGSWHDATATVQGDEIVVTSPAVSEPVGVRYAWVPEPTQANLYNRDGFPALPFSRP